MCRLTNRGKAFHLKFIRFFFKSYPIFYLDCSTETLWVWHSSFFTRDYCWQKVIVVGWVKEGKCQSIFIILLRFLFPKIYLWNKFFNSTQHFHEWFFFIFLDPLEEKFFGLISRIEETHLKIFAVSQFVGKRKWIGLSRKDLKNTTNMKSSL